MSEHKEIRSWLNNQNWPAFGRLQELVANLLDGYNQSQLDLEQANVKIKLCEAQIIFVEKTSIAKQVQADKDIQVLAEALNECADDMAHYCNGENHSYVEKLRKEYKELANKHKDKV